MAKLAEMEEQTHDLNEQAMRLAIESADDILEFFNNKTDVRLRRHIRNTLSNPQRKAALDDMDNVVKGLSEGALIEAAVLFPDCGIGNVVTRKMERFYCVYYKQSDTDHFSFAFFKPGSFVVPEFSPPLQIEHIRASKHLEDGRQKAVTMHGKPTDKTLTLLDRYQTSPSYPYIFFAVSIASPQDIVNLVGVNRAQAIYGSVEEGIRKI